MSLESIHWLLYVISYLFYMRYSNWFALHGWIPINWLNVVSTPMSPTTTRKTPTNPLQLDIKSTIISDVLYMNTCMDLHESTWIYMNLPTILLTKQTQSTCIECKFEWDYNLSTIRNYLNRWIRTSPFGSFWCFIGFIKSTTNHATWKGLVDPAAYLLEAGADVTGDLARSESQQVGFWNPGTIGERGSKAINKCGIYGIYHEIWGFASNK